MAPAGFCLYNEPHKPAPSSVAIETVTKYQLNTQAQFKMKYFAVLLLLCALLGSALATLKNPVCGEEFAEIGTCRALQPMWSYRQETNECISFNYSGCQGNNNLFESQSICEQTCKV